MPKRIVITGASGNVGTALLRRLTADDSDYEIVGISRRRPPSDDVYRSAHWHELDLADSGVELELLKVFRGAACVVHLAWGFQPTRNRRYLDAVGVNGSAAVLSAAHNAKVPHLLHMSSVGTYAAGRYGQKVDETFSTAGIPSSAYSRAKSAVEHMLDGYEGHNPDGVGITRMRPGFILQRDAALGLRRYTLPAYVDPRWVRWLPLLPLDRSLSVSIVHADDVADACVKAIERRALGPFNLAAEPPVGRDDIAKALRARPIHVPSPLLGLLVAASWRARLQPLDRGWTWRFRCRCWAPTARVTFSDGRRGGVPRLRWPTWSTGSCIPGEPRAPSFVRVRAPRPSAATFTKARSPSAGCPNR